MAKNFRTNVVEGGLLVDPTAGAGVVAAVGTLLVRRGTREVWQKFGAGNTDWQLFPQNGSIMFWGNDDIGAANNTVFLTPGHGASVTTADTRQTPMPRAGTLRNLFVRQNAGAGDGDNVVYTVRVNGVNTGITVTLASNVLGQGSDQVNTASVVIGDRVDITAVKALNITNGNLQVCCSLELL